MDVLEDFRGVTRGSYATLRTERNRVQVGAEATAAARWLGFDHELLAGAGYRRMPVTTEQWWPGSGVRALERRDVFFRTFQLTGFALPTRAQQARSVHDHAELYLQDTARRGRLGVTLGLRLDRLAGHNLPSSVEASPLFPALLPAVSYSGAGAGHRVDGRAAADRPVLGRAAATGGGSRAPELRGLRRRARRRRRRRSTTRSGASRRR